MLKPRSFFIVLPVFLAACGSTPQDRAITGGGIGAAGGAIIGAVTGLSVVQGVLIGTGLGAAFGGLTTPDKVNFGEPFWKRSNGSGSAGTATGPQEHSKAVADIQRDLKKLGYNTGPVDGVLGPKTKMAIAQFERDQGRAPGQPVDQLAKDAEKLAATPSKSLDN